MPTITVKNIPEDVYERLKEQAKRNRRSINSEIITLMERAVMSYRIDPDEFIERARVIRESLKFVATEEEINQAKNEGRP
ncbi:MAG: Arc family DNA-binding protein [Ardenticatenaceae bacterium]|nr:Arc family DNA-binding protein [Ardenticatenaceae bacterium]MCB9444326.1 Arc family DNA-binding protein [Ardenticatenaceae bacterium]